MRSRPYLLDVAALAALAVLAAVPAARAWTPATHERIAERAALLMPASLQAVLAEHRQRLVEGATAGLGSRAEGDLEQAVMVQVQRVLDLLTERQPLSVVAYEMGVLSQLVALAQDPARVGGGDPDEGRWTPHFHGFVESRMPRMRAVFDGYLAEPLERDDVRAFVAGASERSRRYYPVLAQSWHLPEGGVVDGAPFDDRHPVFGVASLAFSHAISDTAKIWLYAWIRADGDVGGLPFPRAMRTAALAPGSGQ